MNDTHDTSHIKDRILKDITSGDVVMTPRSHFTLKLAALAAVALVGFVVSIYAFSILYFSIRVGHIASLLSFGPSGLTIFLRFFPWKVLLLDVGLVLLLLWLVRHFKIGYRTPVLYGLAGLLFAAALLGFVLDKTTINERLERSGRLPTVAAQFFERVHRPLPPGSGICRCTILSVDGNTLTVAEGRGTTRTLQVMVRSDARYATTTGLAVGDIVFIAGVERDGVIQAFGIRKLTPRE